MKYYKGDKVRIKTSSYYHNEMGGDKYLYYEIIKPYILKVNELRHVCYPANTFDEERHYTDKQLEPEKEYTIQQRRNKIINKL